MNTNFELSELPKVAENLLKQTNSKVICFYGPMGTGKTTFIKALLKELGAVDTCNSPTFGLVNEYENAKGELIAYHFDFYRIKNETEVYDIGIEEYFASDAYIFIEWPEKIPNLLPLDHYKITLQFIDENTRSVEF